MLSFVPGTTPTRGRWTVQRVVSTGSTNADLLALARQGAPDGLVLVAEEQTAGRGRLGRTWEARRGSSLLVSLLVRPAPDLADLHLLTQWVALAAVRACQEVCSVQVALKWPNDLVIGSRKLAGVLAESVVEGERVTAVVIGIGLNVNWSTPLPPELADRAVALNEMAGRSVSRSSLLAAMLDALEPDLDPGDVRAAYRRTLSTVGQPVRVETPTDTFEGIAVEVHDDGRLEVAVDGQSRLVAAADVTHLRHR
jgi:BirA family biotin operon repressor/biotin-[acetyl-CoA-carboxylase] ligase